MPRSNPEIKEAIKEYIDQGISRRQFLTTLTTIGLSLTAARTMADEFSPFVTRPGEPPAESLPGYAKRVSGSGGKLLVEQLKAAGVRYIFINPSSGETPIYDAMVDEEEMHFIQAIHEGSLAGMADGYARASGETPFVMFARPGLPNAMTQMYNAWKDYIPMLVAVDNVSTASLGQDGFEDVENMTSLTAPMVKWHWQVVSTAKIPEVTRRGLKFASTHPRRPVLLAYPTDTLSGQADTAIMDQSQFSPSMTLPPDRDAIRRAAKLLIEAKNPVLLAGNEIRYCSAERELLELAELLSIPVTVGDIVTWCRPFPTNHPLYLGEYLSTSRYPGKVDVMLNLGSRMPYWTGSTLQMESQVKLVQIRLDPDNLARTYPTEIGIVADIKLAAATLIDMIRQQAPSKKELKRIAADRLNRAKAYQTQRKEVLRSIAQERWNNAPISGERLTMELEKELDKDSVIINENDTYNPMINSYMTFGPGNKDHFANGGAALGWGLPAAFGVKLAMPDRPAIAVISDGAFLFSGPQPLWSYSRYQAAIMVIVLNNQSYNNERNRIMSRRGRSYDTGRDMVCYLGNPDIDYAKQAAGYGIGGEVVRTPDTLKAAIRRGKQAMDSGEAYILDVHMERRGSLENSTWHPQYTIASLNK